MPDSKRSLRALVKKWRELVNKGGGVVLEEGSEAGSEDEGEQEWEGHDEEEQGDGNGDVNGDVAMAEPFAVPTPTSGSTMQTHSGRRLLLLNTAQTWDAQPDEGQTDNSLSPSGSMDMGADLDVQPTDEPWLFTPPPGAEEQQLQTTASSASCSGAALPAATAAALPSAAPPASQVPPPNFSFTSTRQGIRVTRGYLGVRWAEGRVPRVA